MGVKDRIDPITQSVATEAVQSNPVLFVVNGRATEGWTPTEVPFGVFTNPAPLRTSAPDIQDALVRHRWHQ